MKDIGAKHGISVSEIALRWLNHHSALKRAHGDSIITGGKNIKNIEASLRKYPCMRTCFFVVGRSPMSPMFIYLILESLDKPPLPDDVVKVTEEVWQLVKGSCQTYHNNSRVSDQDNNKK